MKIALVRQRYNPYGGAERFVARALEALKERGVAVTVFARDWNTSGDASGDTARDAIPAEFVRCFAERPTASKAIEHRITWFG